MSTEETARSVSSARKKRGVAKAAITRLSNRLVNVEARTDAPNASLQAQQMLKNLDDEDTLDSEQAALGLPILS